MSTHDRLDLTRWLREFPLTQLRAEDPDLSVYQIDGPRDIALLEQLRAEADPAARGEGIPADVCVWNIGEPANPAITKVGGSPYRPTDAPWPTASDGSLLGLLAQFNFTDSLDVLAPIPPAALPGDVLLVFTKGPHMYGDWDPDEPDTWALEWHRVSPGLRIPPARHILDMTPAFATLHRTMDYPSANEDDDGDIVWGTKFGGVHRHQLGDLELPGTPLCTLASINPFGNPWPLLNVAVNPKGENYLDSKLLMIGDLGSAYFNLDTDGRVHWTADCG